jgi:serine/threonine-protein kinase
VVNVNPDQGTQVNPGSTVTLTVSGGNQQVPEVEGLPLNSAIALLQQAGFQVNAQQEAGPGQVTPGVVWHQNPPQGTSEPPGFKVTIFYQPQNVTPTQGPTVTPTTPAPTATATGSPPPNGGGPPGNP